VRCLGADGFCFGFGGERERERLILLTPGVSLFLQINPLGERERENRGENWGKETPLNWGNRDLYIEIYIHI